MSGVVSSPLNVSTILTKYEMRLWTMFLHDHYKAKLSTTLPPQGVSQHTVISFEYGFLREFMQERYFREFM